MVDRKNVVVIVVDTLRADKVKGKRDGQPVMPNISRFADESWFFTNAYAQASWTKPSVVSIFSSLYPEVHNIQFGLLERSAEVDILSDNILTMAEYFKQNGWSTLGVNTNVHIQGKFGFGQGFESYEYHAEFLSDSVTDRAIELLKGKSKPFFLYLHYIDPHNPYDAPEEYQKKFNAPQVSGADKDILGDFMEYYNDLVFYQVGVNKERRYKYDLEPAGIEYVKYQYDGDVLFADAHVGRLIDYIRANHNDTVIIFTSDHGEEFWEHGSLGHGKTVYEELVNVPLIMNFPGMKPWRIDTVVELIDILPTLSSYFGLDPAPEWQGVDLINYLKNGQVNNRAVYSHTRSSLKEANIYSSAVIKDGYKLITDINKGSTKLFNLSEDKLEKVDITGSKNNVAEELIKLEKNHREINMLLASKFRGGGSTKMSEEDLKRLKALGYLH